MSICWNFIIFLPYVDPFWHKNSGDWRNLTPKAIKAKKADIRPNVSMWVVFPPNKNQDKVPIPVFFLEIYIYIEELT